MTVNPVSDADACGHAVLKRLNAALAIKMLSAD